MWNPLLLSGPTRSFPASAHYLPRILPPGRHLTSPWNLSDLYCRSKAAEALPLRSGCAVPLFLPYYFRKHPPAFPSIPLPGSLPIRLQTPRLFRSLPLPWIHFPFPPQILPMRLPWIPAQSLPQFLLRQSPWILPPAKDPTRNRQADPANPRRCIDKPICRLRSGKENRPFDLYPIRLRQEENEM